MKIDIKNRKILYIIFGILLASVFTLTVVYAALSTVLTINGQAEVTSASWDIYFDNIKVNEGSVEATKSPTKIDSKTINFIVGLKEPGDYYKFTVDVVNNGTIDAMIDSVVKTPELTAEQSKYFNYDITYHSGESITSKQLVKSGSFVRLKVRLEYKKNLTASDLPTSNVSLSLGCTLVYSQADNNGVDVDNNGIFAIKFNVLEKEYSISKEMTWEEWLTTPDGISSGIYIENDYMCDPKMSNLIVNSNGEIMDIADYITNDSYTYSNRVSCNN